MKVRSGTAIALLLLFGGSGCESPGYYAGYQAGKADIRKARQEGGLGTTILINVIPPPQRPDKPADWNAGFRQGWADELNRP